MSRSNTNWDRQRSMKGILIDSSSGPNAQPEALIMFILLYALIMFCLSLTSLTLGHSRKPLCYSIVWLLIPNHQYLWIAEIPASPGPGHLKDSFYFILTLNNMGTETQS